MKLSDINVRDPFIFPFENKYYLYGTRAYNCWEQPEDLSTMGFDVYISDNLEEWEGPKEIFRYTDDFWGIQNFWAPEVHYYNHEFYLLASFLGRDQRRAVQAFKADQPDGKFKPFSKRLTPADWDCLDGTLYVDEQQTPYLIYCHEWKQITDGTMDLVILNSDLSDVASSVSTMFASSSLKLSDQKRRLVTDGPYLTKLSTGALLMIWSTMDENDEYIEVVSKSDNGRVDGHWEHARKLLFSKDGGHGMIFKALDGSMAFVFHRPNLREQEHPVIIKTNEEDLLNLFN